ncbi:MAG: Asp-tRNA(Asn)/Glu-tRNA(Gln) amidotransferase subunit GatC [bacterium]|nr:Asp-tRNA(Asn)/Glu-tRNA(Gln) amidotransferase subunit GatC [bacterium]
MVDITKTTVNTIANLARIELTEKEEEKMAKELGSILSYIDKLKEVDTSNVEADASPHHGLINHLRKDDKSSHNAGDNTEKLLAQAPETKDGFVKVPSILEKK